jgi:hypothetical protein
LFDTLPKQAHLELIVETEEVHHAIHGCKDITRYKQEAQVMIPVPAWERFMGTWLSQGTTRQIRQFDEEGLDVDCIRMRVLALWEADEAINCLVSERDPGPLSSPKELHGGKPKSNDCFKEKKSSQRTRCDGLSDHARPVMHQPLNSDRRHDKFQSGAECCGVENTPAGDYSLKT